MSDEQTPPALVGQVDRQVRLVSHWMGRPMDELTREELLEVVEWCGHEMERLRGEPATQPTGQ